VKGSTIALVVMGVLVLAVITWWATSRKPTSSTADIPSSGGGGAGGLSGWVDLAGKIKALWGSPAAPVYDEATTMGGYSYGPV
jgi:hypothetical protein